MIFTKTVDPSLFPPAPTFCRWSDDFHYIPVPRLSRILLSDLKKKPLQTVTRDQLFVDDIVKNHRSTDKMSVVAEERLGLIRVVVKITAPPTNVGGGGSVLVKIHRST